MVTTLDKFGRVIIPKKLREQMGITPGTILNIDQDGSRIFIEPVQAEAPLIEEEGVLIYTGKLQGNIEQFLQEDRKRRLEKLMTGTNK